MAALISARKPRRGEMSIPETNRSSSKVCRFWGSAITVTSLLPSRHNGSAQYRSATLRGTNFSMLSSTVADPQSTYRRPVTCSRAATRSSLDTRPRPSRSSPSRIVFPACSCIARVRLCWEICPRSCSTSPSFLFLTCAAMRGRSASAVLAAEDSLFSLIERPAPLELRFSPSEPNLSIGLLSIYRAMVLCCQKRDKIVLVAPHLSRGAGSILRPPLSWLFGTGKEDVGHAIRQQMNSERIDSPEAGRAGE